MSNLLDLDRLAEEWSALAARLPAGWRPGGVTYHAGSAHRPWVAFVIHAETWSTGPEGWGDDPFEAMQNLEIELGRGKQQQG